MSQFYVPLPAPRMPANAMANFAPLNQAVQNYGQTTYRNAMAEYAVGQDARQNARADERQGWERDRQQRSIQDRKAKAIGAAAQSLLDMTPEQRPQALAALRSIDPELDSDLGNLGFRADDVESWAPVVIGRARGFQDPMESQKQLADVEYKRARADYYTNRSAGGGSLSSRERVIERLMHDDPDLTYAEALRLSQRAPHDDTISRERLALQGARNGIDPEDLNDWRERYGVGPGAQQPSQVNGGQGNGTRLPDYSGGYRDSNALPGSRGNPLVPHSQADIDNAPPGTIFMIDGQILVK